MIVLRRQVARGTESLSGDVKVSLPQSEYSPIGPNRRLTGRDLRGLSKFVFSSNIVAHLQRSQSNVKGRHKREVFF